jgi:chromate reductase
MKNALDWMVAIAVFLDKPVALWNASPRASIALAALRATLKVMSARVVDAASLELLILPAHLAEPPANPDPIAMHRALQALRAARHQEAQRSPLAV